MQRVGTPWQAGVRVDTTLPAGSHVTVGFPGHPGILEIAVALQQVDGLDFSGSVSATPWQDSPWFGIEAGFVAGPVASGDTVTLNQSAGFFQQAGWRTYTLLGSTEGTEGAAFAFTYPTAGAEDGALDFQGHLGWRFLDTALGITHLDALTSAAEKEVAYGMVRLQTTGTVVPGSIVGSASSAGDTVVVPVDTTVTAPTGLVAWCLLLVDDSYTYTDATLWPSVSDDVIGSTNVAKGNIAGTAFIERAESPTLRGRFRIT